MIDMLRDVSMILGCLYWDRDKEVSCALRMMNVYCPEPADSMMRPKSYSSWASASDGVVACES
jgi:hypothetical protein